jgi:hypothetical protein
MPRGGKDNTCQELNPSLQFIHATAEAIWAHWGAWQKASGGWEDSGALAPEPHPMAEDWDIPCGTERYAFRTRVTDQPLRMGNFSFELRTYDPCEILVWASHAEQPQWVPLAESQTSPLRLLPRG